MVVEHLFTGLFLTKEGTDAQNQGLETDGIDEYYYTIKVAININEIESYYETKKSYDNKTVLNARTRSGDDWSLLITMKEMIDLKNNIRSFNSFN